MKSKHFYSFIYYKLTKQSFFAVVFQILLAKMYQTNEVREDFLPHHRDQVCQLSNVNGNELTIQHQIQHPVSNEQLQQQQQQQSHDNLYHVYELGFYGWKKKCLYLFIVTVTIVILINALLTLWIIAILSFSMVIISQSVIRQSNILINHFIEFSIEWNWQIKCDSK